MTKLINLLTLTLLVTTTCGKGPTSSENRGVPSAPAGTDSQAAPDSDVWTRNSGGAARLLSGQTTKLLLKRKNAYMAKGASDFPESTISLRLDDGRAQMRETSHGYSGGPQCTATVEQAGTYKIKGNSIVISLAEGSIVERSQFCSADLAKARGLELSYDAALDGFHSPTDEPTNSDFTARPALCAFERTSSMDYSRNGYFCAVE